MLLVGDLHYDLRQLDWVLDQAPGHHLVVLAGDLLDIASAVPVDVQVPVVPGYLERLAAKGTTVASACRSGSPSVRASSSSMPGQGSSGGAPSVPAG